MIKRRIAGCFCSSHNMATLWPLRFYVCSLTLSAPGVFFTRIVVGNYYSVTIIWMSERNRLCLWWSTLYLCLIECTYLLLAPYRVILHLRRTWHQREASRNWSVVLRVCHVLRVMYTSESWHGGLSVQWMITIIPHQCRALLHVSIGEKQTM